LGFLDICVDRVYFDIGIEWRSRLSSDLLNIVNCSIQGRLRTHQSFTLLDIFFSEQELPVKVREVDGIEVENCDVAKTSQYKIFHYKMEGS